MSPEFPSRGRAGLWLRFLGAAAIVIVLVAGATATAGLNVVQSFVNDLKQGGTIHGLGGVITRAQVGDPQTILLIGSDHRSGDAQGNARSDTMMLVHLDPDASATTVLSIPRDLKVDYQYKGAFYTGRKINETFTVGGEALTAKVIHHLLGNIEINHVVDVDFKGFRAAVDAIGCVYADVDHHYYHSNLGSVEQYDEIDIPAGYQKLCGEDALHYVRYRHTDSDFVRAARQQDFLRQIKAQYGIGRFIQDPHKITRRIGRYMRTDASLLSKEELLSLVNLLAYSASQPIRQVKFQASDTLIGGVSFVVATPEQIAAVRYEFVSPPPSAGKASSGHGGRHGRRHRAKGPSTSGLVNVAQTSADYAIRLGGTRIPVYYPRLLTANGQYASPETGVYPRKYRIRDPDGNWHDAYRLVVAIPTINGAYYGIEGTGWTDPPILRNPSADTRTINGKKLLLVYDGTKLRTVGWKTSRAAYWVQNTLQETLTNDQMLAIAGSLTRLGR